MSEQSAYHQNEESEQQLSNHQKGEDYESNRQICSGILRSRTRISAALTENTRGGWLISAMRCICLIYRKPISE